MVGEGMVTTANRFLEIALATSRTVALIAIIAGAIFYGTGTNEGRRRHGRSLIYGGVAAAVTVYFVGGIYQLIAWIVAGSGPIPSTEVAMFPIGTRGLSITSPGADQSLYPIADVLSKVAALLGQACVALGAAIHGSSQPYSRFRARGRVFLSTGIGLILSSMAGLLLVVASYVFSPVL
jgi:hypothetical protein